jgi:predicted DNA-binding transcriptional regulator AlpA
MLKKKTRARKRMRREGTHCVWPAGVCQRYDISIPTRWRWERDGKLPPRDVSIGGIKVGWRPGTLDAADAGGVRDDIQQRISPGRRRP